MRIEDIIILIGFILLIAWVVNLQLTIDKLNSTVEDSKRHRKHINHEMNFLGKDLNRHVSLFTESIDKLVRQQELLLEYHNLEIKKVKASTTLVKKKGGKKK